MAKLFTESTNHKMLNGVELIKRREETGLSQAMFASACGYTQQYQQRLETKGFHEITSSTAEQILAVLKKYNQSVV